jgi:hypothetical protein
MTPDFVKNGYHSLTQIKQDLPEPERKAKEECKPTTSNVFSSESSIRRRNVGGSAQIHL